MTHLQNSRLEKALILLGILLSAVTFARNIALPELFRGRVCCDSTDYIALSEKLHSPAQLWTYPPEPRPGAADRTWGYPAFLAMQRGVAQGLGLTADPVDFALTVSWIFYLAAALAFYFALSRRIAPVHPVFALVLLAHPGLVSHAAIPLSDTFATSWVILGASALAALIGTRPPLGKLRVLGLSTAWGACWGAAAVVRPTLAIPLLGAVTLTALWALTQRARRNSLLSLCGAALLGFSIALSPQAIGCAREFGTACLQRPSQTHTGMTQTLSMALSGARTYSLLGSEKMGAGGLITVRDSFMMEHFGPQCPIDPDAPGASLRDCYVQNFAWLPLYFAKKVVGLFDHFHLNTYAAKITSSGDRWLGRLLGMLAFLGFGVIAAAAIDRLRKRHWDSPELALSFFPLLYIGFSSIPHIESRYSLPAVPFCWGALALTFSHLRGGSLSRKALFALAVAALFFLGQTLIWDALDPVLTGAL